MENLTPRTREEEFLRGAAEGGTDLIPLQDVRREAFLKRLSDPTYPRPEGTQTREEWFLDQAAGGGGGSITVEELDVTENGTYTAPAMTAYNPVNVDVPLPQNALLLKDIPSTPTAIATFADGAEMVMPSLKVAIEPVQEGSGDPSPTNIRPISGWDEVNVRVSGVNVWDEETESGRINTKTGENTTGVGERSKNPVPVKPNKTIYIKSDDNCFILEYGADKSFIKYSNYYKNEPFTTGATTHYIRFYSTVENGLSGVSINYPSTDTEYHAYNGHTYTIDLDGTRYGGELDVVSGTMTVTHEYSTFDGSADEGWTVGTSNAHSRGYTYALSDIKPHSANSQPTSAICDKIKTGTWESAFNGTLVLGQTGKAIGFGLDSLGITNDTDLNAWLSNNPITIVYELATPLTIQLTPTAVKSLEGDNNVFADSGEILEGEYLGGVS